MAKKVEEIKNEVVKAQADFTDLSIVDDVALMEIFGSAKTQPAIVKINKDFDASVKELVNLCSGENKSLNAVVNKELRLNAFGGARLQYADRETGELIPYTRYLIFTDEGTFTTSSSFVGRFLSNLYGSFTPGEEVKVKVTIEPLDGGKSKFAIEWI